MRGVGSPVDNPVAREIGMSAQGGSAPQDVFEVAIAEGIAHLKLNRPDKMNSMNRAFWSALPAIVRDIDENARARVIVISSTGKHFSAGMDLEVFAENGALASGQQDPHVAAEAFRHLVLALQGTFSCLDEARIPVIAAIQGGCIGGAVDMTSACDIRYCTADAFFCIQEINIGMVADVGTLQRLPKLVPLGVVKELAYTGRRLPAQKALGYGLVNEVFDTQDAMVAAALKCAAEIAAKPPVAIWGTKQVIHFARDHSVDDALKQMGWVQGAIWSNAHVRESVTAMKEKRAAIFPDLPRLSSFTDLEK
jgi:enoyl-CoA hydratase